MQPSFAARLPLSRFQLDRDAAARERPQLFEELWADPATRILPIYQGAALLASPTSLALLPVSAAPDGDLRVYLGRSISPTSPEPVGTPIVAVEIEDATQLAEAEWGSLRTIGAALDDRDAGMLTEALAIFNWHASHRFSPRTGEPTIVEKGGWVRRDPVANTEIFPRTDPAVIVGVLDADDRLLLGSNALWESNRYSLLAGFVEPGESFEAAIVREILEESGIPVVDPVYLGSQPWPFPASIMVGFTARVDPAFTGDAVPDGTEIMDLRWFSREELAASLDEIRLPGRASIARAIVEEWYGAEIDDGQA
ncbi:NAD(+) diphosphatase [Leifsonia sp. H3M29-4]|uniref:NAD(+) diphosphatase n=1 Tax=Salinibacterium metalliresistens TaxID=3031321 RepID=UPI0023D9E530|nr:NAD(+) diphosphatase [Salinibacterium metalliresistens]MDF1479545.1 NAD(+) diphosphatase [Salinibacterium metalliresistens]